MALIAFPDWRKLLRTARPRTGSATLDRRHVYILPTRSGLLFGLILMGMLLGSINYSLSLGFVLTFWLAGMGLVAMLHTWRNLAHLDLSPGRTSPVFAGEAATLHYMVADKKLYPRHAIGLQCGNHPPAIGDVPGGGMAEIGIALPTERRGWLRPGRLTVFTQFPLGLFHAWGYVELDMACLIYPRPAPPGKPLPVFQTWPEQHGRFSTSGDEDFSGLRDYRTGDSMRRIDWKASARGMSLYTKEFEGEGQSQLWLDWETTPGHDTEARLAQLVRWALDAHQESLNFGLKLPGSPIAPGCGDSHLHACLKAMALFGEQP